jgi:serine protease
MHLIRTAFLLAIGIVAATSATAQAPKPAEEFNGSPSRSARAQPTGRILVKWRKDAVRTMSSAARMQKATAVAGLKLQRSPASADDHEVLQVEGEASTPALAQAVANLESDASVEYASIEHRRKAHKLTNDPLLNDQWYLLSAQPAATRSELAWDVTEGDANIVVAVLDTGVLAAHPDLGTFGVGNGKVLPGYDFVSNATVANDSDGRDANPTDPGDWVTIADQNNPLFDDCDETPSSWHGTRVAGLVAAQTDNAAGVAGNAWRSLILPVRVLGKCGGTDDDIIAGMRWAAGLPVTGLPLNPHPAKVINLSLGGEGPCTSFYQNAVNEVIAMGALVVASAGNEGTQVSAPANCSGVLGVAGIRHIGTKVGFSNLGPQVGISAPGGNCVNVTGGPCLFPIGVATNAGSQGPGVHGYTDQLNFNVGTSFSAPMAASAAALLRAVNGSLTPQQIVFLLKDSATPFPNNPAVGTCTVPTPISAPQDEECNCTTDTCGAGMLNTGAAIAAATNPLAVVQTSGNATVGSTLTLNGSSSFATAGHSITSYQWSVANVTGVAPTIANASAASTTLQLPGVSEFTLRLTVMDEQGTTDTKEISLATLATPPPGPTPTPTPAPPAPVGGIGGGGGGGSLGFELLVLGLLGAVVRRRKR